MSPIANFFDRNRENEPSLVLDFIAIIAGACFALPVIAAFIGRLAQ